MRKNLINADKQKKEKFYHSSASFAFHGINKMKNLPMIYNVNTVIDERSSK